MRLLKVRDDGALEFTEDLDSDIPPYAILSHTWGDDCQEVTFKDIKEGTGRYKQGYRKIRFCSAQAALDGLRYFWIDTCCIDRSNFTELSEAINSMFRWYQNARCCYVYLSDIPDANRSTWRTWQEEFRMSRWFARGWTLQELIAPSSVKFFASNGDVLGNKVSLKLALHEITGVPINVLLGGSLSAISIEERMTWASHRQTKKKEDKAYSLLGIFSVSMPLLYGEGEEKAFYRLRTEINLQSRTMSNKAYTAAGAASSLSAKKHNPAVSHKSEGDVLRQMKEGVDCEIWRWNCYNCGCTNLSYKLSKKCSSCRHKRDDGSAAYLKWPTF
ncbi:HET-domain-containing protein [Xylariaceae sp. AK1471]|nr:HET-domain-containing protein [Xylariaceae sp. AK1471]